jgi:hypothetical protein
VIDLRGDGFSYAGDFTPGKTVRFYDLYSEGLFGGVGDVLIWNTPTGPAQGKIVDTGWENRPLPTYWADAEAMEAPNA